MQNLSENSVEGVRKVLSIMSFMIIVFFFADGQLLSENQNVKLGIINVEFKNSKNLLITLYAIYGWFIFRYFNLKAFSLLKESVISDIKHYVLNDEIGGQLIIKEFVKYKLLSGVNLENEHAIDFKLVDDSLIINFSNIAGNRGSDYEVPDSVIYIMKGYVAFTYGSYITFFTPLILSAVALLCIIFA